MRYGICLLVMVIATGLVAMEDSTLSLYKAVEKKDIDLVDTLLKGNADPNERDPDSLWTPLHTASYENNVPIILQLLKHGAHIDAPILKKGPCFGQTPLHFATFWWATNTVHQLLLHGANPTIADTDGFTPLHNTMNNGDYMSTRLLLLYGAVSSAKTKKGLTLLHREPAQNITQTIKTLLISPQGGPCKLNKEKIPHSITDPKELISLVPLKLLHCYINDFDKETVVNALTKRHITIVHALLDAKNKEYQTPEQVAKHYRWPREAIKLLGISKYEFETTYKKEIEVQYRELLSPLAFHSVPLVGPKPHNPN